MSNTETSTPTTNAPNLIGYQVRENGQKGYFTRISAAWSHKDGNGFTALLDSIPLDGKIVFRIASENK